MDDAVADDTADIMSATQITSTNNRYLFYKPKSSNELTAPSI